MSGNYLVESYLSGIDHNGRSSIGVLGDPLDRSIKEKIYLHVLPVTDREIALLGPRVDDDGNKQHGRLAPRDEIAFWIAVEGEIAWPRVLAPRIVSKCELDAKGIPRPVPLDAAALERLRKAGLQL